jgi:hypothetical protein
MDEDTYPYSEGEMPAPRTINTFTTGQRVSYTSIQGKTTQGTVIRSYWDYANSHTARKYEVRMDGSTHAYIYLPRELKAVVEVAAETPAAPAMTHDLYDQLPALRQIEAAFLAWETAYLAGRYEEAGRLSAEHDRLFDTHVARLFRKPVDSVPVRSVMPTETAGDVPVKTSDVPAGYAVGPFSGKPLPAPTKATFMTLARKPHTPEQIANEAAFKAYVERVTKAD